MFLLTPADLRELETEFAKLKVFSGRMNEMLMTVVDPNGVTIRRNIESRGSWEIGVG